MNIKSFSRLTGFVYLLLVPLGVFGIMYVPSLLVEGNLPLTIENIKSNEFVVRLAIAASLFIQLIHFILVLMLYRIFKVVNIRIAKIMVLLVMVGVPIAMLNELNFGAVLFIFANAEISNLLIPLFFELHEFGIMIVGVFWGLWLFPLGYLVYKSNFIPKIIGIALMIGCFGYVIDSFMFIIAPDFGFQFAEFLFVGELMITFWLLIMGVNEKMYDIVKQNAI
ncbi:MAG: DUF4386 domain-containing protein [Rhizobiales bacterium]|nr:DUF4386 domain-containing protein [Hyphomicrobiales bacterium]